MTVWGDRIGLGLVLNAVAGWWWAGLAAGYVLVYCAAREVREIFTPYDDAALAGPTKPC